MDFRRYAAELLGTFLLTFIVLIALAMPASMPLATPLLAAITLGTLVYTIGEMSGAHVNPAVTIAMLSVNKIKAQDALFYIIAQLLGATAAMMFSKQMVPVATMSVSSLLPVGIMEALGAFFFVFGISSVVHKKAPSMLSGVVVGASLLLGVVIASATGNGVLNPAVAFGIGSFGPMYILGPIVGAVLGAWAFCLLYDIKVKF